MTTSRRPRDNRPPARGKGRTKRLTRLEERVLACRGVYRLTDVCRHYGLNHKTVYRIWALEREARLEPPNIWNTKITDDLIAADLWVLLGRGMNLCEVAAHLGVAESRLFPLARRLRAQLHNGEEWVCESLLK